MCMSGALPLTDSKHQICDAFGVTVEQVDALDAALGGPRVRAVRKDAERRVLAHAEQVAAELSDLLPDGLTLGYLSDTTQDGPPG